MTVSVSLELLWGMAAQEAIAGEFAEIEPDHFLAAVLKFAELPVADLDRLAPGARVPRELALDVDKVRDEFQRRAIDTTRMRRKLRRHLGRGDRPYAGGLKHRSAACRAVFDAARRLADDSGSEAVAAEHLLAALLASPSEAMRAVLGNAVASPWIERPETPLMEQFGKDLVQMAAEGHLPESAERQVEAKNLMGLLAEPGRHSVLLVTDCDRSARATVCGAARAIASPDVPPGLQQRRIVDVTSAVAEPEWATETLERLECIFHEALGVPEVVLFVPPIEAPTSPDGGDPWAELLKRSLGSGLVQCVCRVHVPAYKRWIERNYQWKKCARVMWITDRTARKIPWEL